MKGKLEKILMAVLALALAMITTGPIGAAATVFAEGEGVTGIVQNEKMEESELILVPGEVKHMRVPVRAVGAAISDASVIASAPDTPFSISQAALTLADQSPVLYLSNYGTTYVDFDINVKETAKIGNYPIIIEVSGSNPPDGEPVTVSHKINVQVLRELAPAQLTISQVSVGNAVIGGETNITFAMKNEGEITARSTYYSLDYGTTNIAPKYETPNIKAGDLKAGEVRYVSLPVEILSTAEAGLKTVTVNFKYKDSDGTEGTDSHQIYMDVKKNENAPDLMLDDISYTGELKPGAEVTVKAAIRNYGSSKAENVVVKVDEETTGADGFLKNYFTDGIYVGGIKEDKESEAKIPLTVSSQATNGNKKLNLIISYEDSIGNEYSKTIAIYPEVVGGSSLAGESGLVISNVEQSPEEPSAGSDMQVAFDLQNKSQSDITEIKISLEGLDGSTFIPRKSEPYQYVEKLKAGKITRITFPLTVSDSIKEGLNNLSVKITYAGSTAADPVIIPVKNVRNDLGSNSKPKLIISKYTLDPEELRAGSAFNFTFDLYNTHSSVAAKNITVTLSQADNIFSVTQGSNSFFIDNIDAGETVRQTVEMKVKSDATTKAYPLEITIEYDYEGIEPNPETGNIGETKTEKLSLQAVENSRPVLDNVSVYSWEGNVVVGGAATLSFEFYNMGKSPLNNVIATVEGDFTKADGDMCFVGNVEAGASTYQEFDVIPNVEGTAKGTMRVSFEDSNGEKIEFTKDFETEVMSATVYDPNADGGAEETFNPDGVPAVKKAIVPGWAFIIIELAIAAIFVPVTRKVILSIYKARLRKKEQEQY